MNVLFYNNNCSFLPDGIDGKQARRTNSSTPLGELFDHGLDSWTSLFIPTVLYSVFGRVEHTISPARLYFCLLNLLFTFLSSHWEKYNTGILFLPWGYDVSQLVGVFYFKKIILNKFICTIIFQCTLIIYLITFGAGFEFWKFTLPGGITAGALFELLMWGGSLLTSLPVSLWNIYT
jgi:ethanolaminephosphotransferase